MASAVFSWHCLLDYMPMAMYHLLKKTHNGNVLKAGDAEILK